MVDVRSGSVGTAPAVARADASPTAPPRPQHTGDADRVTTGRAPIDPATSNVVDPGADRFAASLPEGRSDGDRADRARAHEAAAETLAARGDYPRAYRHLEAAIALVRPEQAAIAAPTEQLHDEVDRLRRERAEARDQSRRDALTSGWNRRYLDERLATLRGNDQGVGWLALADVDHFKQINDSHGHRHGDEVLRRLAALMSVELPRDAFCARYGGEEFALVLPGLDPGEAVAVCEAARARIDQHCWDEVIPGLHVTVSLGVACLDAVPVAPPARSPLDSADALLYVAKHAGRNAVAFRDPRDGEVRLAGAAAGRRGVAATARSVVPRW